jgi:hypothetical protein
MGSKEMAHFAAIVFTITVFLGGNVAYAGDFVWKRVAVATYPAGVDFANGQARNHVVYLEVTGPPRNSDEAKKELMDYVQESVNLALGSALVAFEDTPGEVSVKVGAAYGQFQSTITYRATQVSAFRSMATFEIREAEEEVSSDSLKLEWHDPNKAITAEVANRLKTAFPAATNQIGRLADAYVYINTVTNPPLLFSVNVKEIADKLAVPQDVIEKTAKEAQKFAGKSAEEITKAVDTAVEKGTQEVADSIKRLSDEIEKQAGRLQNLEAWRQRLESLFHREVTSEEAAKELLDPASGILKPEDIANIVKERLGRTPTAAEIALATVNPASTWTMPTLGLAESQKELEKAKNDPVNTTLEVIAPGAPEIVDMLTGRK